MKSSNAAALQTHRYHILLAPARDPLTGSARGDSKEVVLDAIDCHIDRPNEEDVDSAYFIVTGQHNKTILLVPLDRVIECVAMDAVISQEELVKKSPMIRGLS
jgi:hypothetical protein